MATKEKEKKEGGSRKKGGDKEQQAPKEHTGVGLAGRRAAPQDVL